MAKTKTYRLTFPRRLANALIKGLLRVGLAPPGTYLLVTRGRKTGKLRSTPVTLVEERDQRWLVAPYGEVGWVHNVRAVGRATLVRGRRSEELAAREVSAAEAGPVLKKYLVKAPITAPFFAARRDAPTAAFEAEAHRHPVFRLIRIPTSL